THELAALVAKGLRLELRTALREAIETNTVVARTDLEIDLSNGLRQPFSLTVSPMAPHPGTEPLFLVVFTETTPPRDRDTSAAQAETSRDDTIRRLERELSLTRERLQSIVEEYETSLEEVKSSNEELYSVNEEMQSGNEELEASKEEVQSINEELHTVNNELSLKIQALDQLAIEQAALFASTEIASVFLDTDLRIRTITDAAAQIFGIETKDRGRLLSNFAAPFPLSWLGEDVRAIMNDGGVTDRLLDGTDGNRYRVRLTLSRINGEMSGIIANFVRIADDAA
ncbi:MAG: chemotaxis protein CheR, partial [Oxalobacteraceae bacterium]